MKNHRKAHYTSLEILDGIKHKSPPVMNYIYQEYYGMVKNFLMNNSGKLHDAEDIFQDALVIIYQKAKSDNLKLECTFGTYLFSICRHLWLRELRNRKHVNFTSKGMISERPEEASHTENLQYKERLMDVMENNFGKLDHKSQKVLKLFSTGVPFKEVARIMGFRSEASAKVRKYICRNKLRALIQQDPSYQELQVEYADG